MIPYARQEIGEEEIAAVAEALRSDWLTTGPQVDAFEREFAAATGAREAVALSSGTAALHAALHVLDLGPGDEVIVPAMTFSATANAVLYVGATPVFADVDARTLLIDPQSVAERISPRTRAIIAVDYAGQPADYKELKSLCASHRIRLVSDACHALGATYDGEKVGSLADISTFSFHPAKHMTTGEGGMCTTGDAELARNMRRFRNHGLDSDHRTRSQTGRHAYDLVELGFNYRLTDIQCALGRVQLKRLPGILARRSAIAGRYEAAFRDLKKVKPLTRLPDRTHAWHLFVVRLDTEGLGMTRDEAFAQLRAAGIGANVHYAAVHLLSLYRKRFGFRPGHCPKAEAAANAIITLPLFPSMADSDVEKVIAGVRQLERH